MKGTDCLNNQFQMVVFGHASRFVRNVPLPIGIISNLFRHGNVLGRRRKGRTLRVSARHRFGR
jgi:hypothetical protein